MKKILPALFVIIITLTGCNDMFTDRSAPAVIPEPVEMEMKDGSFLLNRETAIHLQGGEESLISIAEQLKDALDSATGFDLEIHSYESEDNDESTILLSLGGDTTGNEEGYNLDVSSDRILIQSSTPAGVFYGMQTLLQLFPPEIYHTDYTLVPQNTRWEVSALEIKDYPRFAYRGMHLDVARHFFSVDFVKKYIDLMAMQKMNRFHWHLTEDQGWRIEIEQYPRLTEIGAWRDSTLVGHYGSDIYDGKRYGGYYTQEEIRDVVEYAEKRHITVIPEIEMPGHSSAALAAYPEFGCVEGKDYQVQTTWGIFDDIYCPSEETFTFLESVLAEVMDLFPSEFIHIGGDEAPKVQWEESDLAQQVIEREGLADEHELQSYFISRIEEFLNKNGRQIIGWDEILEGGLAPNATVMSWRGVEGGIEAAKQGHNAIMTPGSHCYLDHYQDDEETEPLAIGGHTTLDKTYSYEPIPDELQEEERNYILGAQGNVWTEYMHSPEKVEYMAWPRSTALAEVTWSPKEKRNWDSFWHRMQTQFRRFDALNVNAAEHYREYMPAF